MYHSQNNEAEVIDNYFQKHEGNLLSLGENDGITFSNSYDLIQKGWSATLFEPGVEAFNKICELHKDNHDVMAYNYGISDQSGTASFFVSDDSLISSLFEDNSRIWSHIPTHKDVAQFLTWDDAQKQFDLTFPFSFVTIDCEGADWSILQQMDLGQMGVECICIEYGKKLAEIKDYCAKYGLTKQLLLNGENIILAK